MSTPGPPVEPDPLVEPPPLVEPVETMPRPPVEPVEAMPRPLVDPAPLVEPVETPRPVSTSSTNALVDPAPSVEPVETSHPSASANLTRVLCIAVAAAAVIFGTLSIGSFLAQGWHPQPALAGSAWLASFGLPVMLGLLSRWATLRILRGIAALEAFCFVVVAGFWLLAGPGPLPSGAEIPWVISFTGVPCVAVAVFARRRVAWAFTALAALLSGAVRFRTTTEAMPGLVGLADGMYSLLLVSVFVALTLAVRRAAARVDDATLLTRQADARRAARVSRRQERLRIDALVHDSVISTLLMAGLGRTPSAVVSAHASKTLRQLDTLRAPAVQPVVLVSDLVRRLSRLTAQIAPDATVHVEDPTRPVDGAVIERTVPSVAVVAMLGAAGEALRNSVASAGGGSRAHGPGRRVRRTVTVLSTADGCEITVSDDGVGFTPAAVPPERLGIAQSIVGRLERVPGGVANVRSAPGLGTDIILAWVPERVVVAPPSVAPASSVPSWSSPRVTARTTANRTAANRTNEHRPNEHRPAAGSPEHDASGDASVGASVGASGDASVGASAPRAGWPNNERRLTWRRPEPPSHEAGTSEPAGPTAWSTARPNAGPTARLTAWSTARPNAGPTARPNAGSTARPAEPLSLAQSLGLSTPTARSILALFVLVHGLLALIDLVPGRPVLLAASAYLAILAAAAALMTHFDGPFPRPRVALILGLSGVGAILMFVYLPVHSGVPFAHWHLGAITLILVVLAIRGQTALAWIGYAALAALAVVWAVATDQSALVGVDLVSRHAGTLLAGTLFVLGLRRTESTLRVLTRDDTIRASYDATTVAAIAEREAELARVNALARPTLQRLATGQPLTDAERAQCLLVEASLRDAIRGRVLFVEPVIAAVAAARHRGVEVTMIDDSAETPPAALPALAATVAEILDTVHTGRITVRVLPAGRADVATLVIDSGTPRLLSITPAGTPRLLSITPAGTPRLLSITPADTLATP